MMQSLMTVYCVRVWEQCCLMQGWSYRGTLQCIHVSLQGFQLAAYDGRQIKGDEEL